ncbi:MAG: bile acid:sodium symporter family protein [Bacteroidales bacterium]|nr:bile acid:sodium symporter family protein [Bacteroidales bacterium]
MNAILIVLPILTLLMFDLGLTLTTSDFLMLKQRPRPILIGLFGQLVCLPLIAFMLGKLFHLEAPFFVGLMLIACSPGGSSSNVFSRLVKGDVALSVTLTAFSSIITFFTIPLIMSLVMRYVGNEASLHLPVVDLIKQNLVLVLLPVIIGMVVRRYAPKVALKIDAVLSKIAFPALITLAIIFFITKFDIIVNNFWLLGSAVTVLLLCSSLMGGGLSRLGRLNLKERRTIVIEVGMQNAAQAIALATSPFVFNNEAIAFPAILYSLMMNVVLLTYVGVIKWRK